MRKNAIIYGEVISGIQKKALALLNEALLNYTLEYPAFYHHNEAARTHGARKFYIGTRKNNPVFELLNQAELTHKEEYRITVLDDTVYIEGADDAGVLYGCIDFFDQYIIKQEYPHDDRYYVNCFENTLPNFAYTSHPSVARRGLWTWGHVIYDYKGYLDNMTRLKLNTLTIWNDRVPVNAKEITDYAHDCGIRIIWGYSWLWDTDCRKIPFDRLCDFSESIFETYEKEYSHLNGDGIYFQSATELGSETIGDTVIADAVTDFVNKTAALFFEKYPHLELQFGLHATSVRKRLASIQNTDPRIRIVWEDCGAFPFSYIPSDIKNFEETKELVRKIAVLRGKEERFGVVTKGLTKLDWLTFEHSDSPQFIGVSSKEMKKNRIERKRKIWRYLQAFWLTNADKAQEMVQMMKDIKNGDLDISALVEDGMFEENVMYPVALFAEILWDTEKDIKTLMSEVALRSYVEFA
ncbi:MAG: hypothetical protein IJ489_10965 [Clostridia bacterium]|nr:hypothetical protein [Clostridia bacterium]